MATEERIERVTAVAGGDLSAAANLFKACKLDASGNVVAIAAITDAPYGILQDVGPTGRALPVAVGGIAKAKAGGTIAAGAQVAVKADGTLQTAVATQYVVGTARYAAVSGDVFSVHLSTANLGIKA
jgi:hypothetical protein